MKRKWFRFFLLSTIGLILLIILLVKFFADPYITKLVNSELNKNPDRFYDTHIKSISINVLNASLKLKEIIIEPRDTARALQNQGLMKTLIFGQIRILQIYRPGILEYLKQKKLLIKKLKIENAEVSILSNPNALQLTTEGYDTSEIKLPEEMNSIVVDNFILLNSRFQYSETNHTGEPLFRVDSLAVEIVNIAVDSATMAKPLPLSFKSIVARSPHISYAPMKYYYAATSGLYLNADDSSVSINNFRLIPKFTKEEYNKKRKYNTDWFSIFVERITVAGFSGEEIDSEKIPRIMSICFDKPVVEVFRDKRLPDEPGKHVPLIHEALKKLKKSFLIDSAMIKEGRIEYSEINDFSEKPGNINFDPMYMTIYNLTNDSSAIAENPQLEVDFRGNLMGKGTIITHLVYDLGRQGEYFTVNGNLGSFNATDVNPMLESLLPVQILSGNVMLAEFSMKGNNDHTDGKLTLHYDNLQVEVKKQKDQSKRSGALTILANGLLRNKNLPDENKYIEGTIHFERRKDRFIINYLWNSIKSGIISVVAPITGNNKKDKKKSQSKMKK